MKLRICEKLFHISRKYLIIFAVNVKAKTAVYGNCGEDVVFMISNLKGTVILFAKSELHLIIITKPH